MTTRLVPIKALVRGLSGDAEHRSDDGPRVSGLDSGPDGVVQVILCFFNY
jgi:hypothetical protein